MRSRHGFLSPSDKVLREVLRALDSLLLERRIRVYKAIENYAASAKIVLDRGDKMMPIEVASSSLPGSAVELSPKQLVS